jgi:hypothetical protein
MRDPQFAWGIREPNMSLNYLARRGVCDIILVGQIQTVSSSSSRLEHRFRARVSRRKRSTPALNLHSTLR